MEKRFTGTVVRATGSWYDVLHDGAVVRCRIRGRLRLRGVRSTNPVVVGDEVTCEADAGGDYVICDISPRRNYVIRRASNLSKESHIIAANVDQALLMATLRSPETATEFVDRFLVTCEAYKVPRYDPALENRPAGPAGRRRLSCRVRKRRIPCHGGLLRHGRRRRCGTRAAQRAYDPRFGQFGRRKIDAHPRHRPLAGHPYGRNLRKPPQGTAHDDLFDDVSAGRRRRGDRHAGHQGFRADRHRRCRVVALLPRNDAHGPRLPVYNCTHTHEPGCAVVEAVERGQIAYPRYESYLKILDEDEKYRK